jgi:hypothetical protein
MESPLAHVFAVHEGWHRMGEKQVFSHSARRLPISHHIVDNFTANSLRKGKS